MAGLVELAMVLGLGTVVVGLVELAMVLVDAMEQHPQRLTQHHRRLNMTMSPQHLTQP